MIYFGIMISDSSGKNCGGVEKNNKYISYSLFHPLITNKVIKQNYYSREEIFEIFKLYFKVTINYIYFMGYHEKVYKINFI